jgi:archaellum component FlaG (FlaF/FlaG flagellin family)
MGMFDHVGDGSYSFWMDAVRIYNPAHINDVNDDTTTNENAEGTGDTATEDETVDPITDAYEKDEESNPSFVTIRDILVGAKSFHADGSAGAVFIDGKLNNGATVVDYTNQGPNNEVYLAGGQTIAFKLVTNTDPSNIQTIQIGAKLAKGSSAQLYYGTKELVKLTTATNMFYKLNNVSWTKTGDVWTSSTIVLTNKATTDTVDQIISLTDVKVTSKVAFEIKTGATTTASELLGQVKGAAIVLCADGLTVERAGAVMNAIENESKETPEENPEDKPTENPEDKPTGTPEDKPTEKPEDKPTEDPEDKPGQTPDQPENGDDSDTSSPSTGDPTAQLIPALTLLVMLCVAMLVVLVKLDANTKKEARR